MPNQHFNWFINFPHTPLTWGIFIYMKEIYNDLEWEIDELPIGCSTPDEFFENSFRAKTTCPECGNDIRGTAQIWSDHEDMINCWLERVDYDPCEECGYPEDVYDEYEEDDDETDENTNNPQNQ